MDRDLESSASRLPDRARKWLWTLGMLGTLIAAPFGYLGAVGLRNETALRASGVTACARATAQRVIERRRGDDYEARYTFDVDGRTYGYGDETGRADLWATLTEESWERARAGGCLEVVYLPEDPSVNRPRAVPAANDPLGNKLAALVLASLTMGMVGLAMVRIFRVARTEVHALHAISVDTWTLEGAAGPREISAGLIRRGVLIVLPAARLRPPWRFATDVLRLDLVTGERLVVDASHPTPALRAALDALSRSGHLKRKRAA